jgi:hypothetical protein
MQLHIIKYWGIWGEKFLNAEIFKYAQINVVSYSAAVEAGSNSYPSTV